MIQSGAQPACFMYAQLHAVPVFMPGAAETPYFLDRPDNLKPDLGSIPRYSCIQLSCRGISNATVTVS